MSAALLLLPLTSRLQLTLVIGESMRPTFEHGDLLVVACGAYKSNPPRRGDIVVARHLGDLIVKRVVGVPGEELEVLDGTLLIDGSPMAETYRTLPGSLEIRKGRLSPGRFALLGDNRSLPPSQILNAVVAEEQIVGRVVLRLHWWPTRTSVPG